MRLSMISIAGATASVAASTSATATASPASGRPSRNAISISTRGWRKRPIETVPPAGTSMSSRMCP
jgi:hypothetical protein